MKRIILLLTLIMLIAGCQSDSCSDVPEDLRDSCCIERGLGDKFDSDLNECVKDELHNQTNKINQTNEDDKPNTLKSFNSTEEIKEYLSKHQTSNSNEYYMERSMDAAPVEEAAQAKGDSGGSAEEYSSTNVQYKDVDEADFVKNDDEYIYMVSGNKMIILDAYPGEEAEIISETTFQTNENDYYREAQAEEIFVKDDKLAVFVTDYEKSFYFQKYDIEPRETYDEVSYVNIYDISNREKPKLEERVYIKGGYYQSRMIDGMIYLVTQDRVNNIDYIVRPYIETKGNTITPEVHYFDNHEDSYQFNTITSIDIASNEVKDSQTLMLGYDNTLMVSENNIYIAYHNNQYWRPWYYNDEYEPERFYDVILPELQGKIKSDIQEVINQNYEKDKEWTEITRVLKDFFMQLENNDTMMDQYEDMMKDVVDAVEEYDTKKALKDEETIIHKISLDDGKLQYQSKGTVKGSLLNQFSMDEDNEHLRVATTISTWVKERIQYNNVYILDEDMETVGMVERLAEDEKIYSTRFIGDKLYMVTFKQIDPFFVIDLSEPENPEVLGELKIPGYSSYLHPFNDNRIIGIGKDTEQNDYAGTVTTGVKVSMYDVSDFENPLEIDKLTLGEEGSDSAVLHDHKAFLLDTDRNLMIIPITEVQEREKLSDYRFSNTVWHGAYVFKVTEDGFEEIGKVKHSSEKSDYWSWWHQTTVMRSLYMDNYLYTISNDYIKVNDLDDNLEELSEVDLPFDERRYY